MKEHLIHAIARLVGNKRYLEDLRKLLDKLPIESGDEATLRYLVADLNHLSVEHNRLERDSKQFRWR